MFQAESMPQCGESRQSKHMVIVSAIRNLGVSIERLEGLRDVISSTSVPTTGADKKIAPISETSLGHFLTNTPSIIAEFIERIDSAVNDIQREIF